MKLFSPRAEFGIILLKNLLNNICPANYYLPKCGRPPGAPGEPLANGDGGFWMLWECKSFLSWVEHLAGTGIECFPWMDGLTLTNPSPCTSQTGAPRPASNGGCEECRRCWGLLCFSSLRDRSLVSSITDTKLDIILPLLKIIINSKFREINIPNSDIEFFPWNQYSKFDRNFY